MLVGDLGFGVPVHALKPYDPAEHLDFRGEAIATCAIWEAARDEFIRIPTTGLGLVRRARLAAVARALEYRLTPVKPEHAEAHAARLACLDWIVHTVSRGSALLTKKTARFLGRFMWGYLERTREFECFFESRRKGLRLVAPPLASLPQTRQCFIGCAYGAPILSSLMRGTGGVRGRGRWPNMFIDDHAYAVLAKNRAASRLMHLETSLRRQLRSPDGLL